MGPWQQLVIGLGKRIPSLLGGVVLIFFVSFEVLWEGHFLIVAFPSKNNRKKYLDPVFPIGSVL